MEVLMPLKLSPNDLASKWCDALAAWLRETKDPRLRFDRDHDCWVIDNVVACSADFCRYMANKAEQSERS